MKEEIRALKDSFFHSLSRAIKLSQFAHRKQYRRDGITPYIAHIKSVVTRIIKKHGNYNTDLIIVAYLHDVLEDSDFTEKDLSDLEFSKEAIEAVKILTKKSNQSYQNYLKEVKQNVLAHKVKIEDMLANLSDDPTDKQIRKYSKGLLYLVD